MEIIMGMYFSSLYKASTDIDHDAKADAGEAKTISEEVESIFDFNHDGKVDWKDVWDYFKSMGGPEELNILKQRLIPIIEMITLPLPSGLTLIIKLVIETLITGINFTQLDTAQERQDALHNLTEDVIKAVVSDITGTYNKKIPALVDNYILSNPAIRLEIENKLLSDPAFQKEVIEALHTSSVNTPAAASKPLKRAMA